MKIARFSRIGFILAASGSAVGLGNIWKFPYIAGENGGGAFVLVYLVTVLAIGFSVMIAEMLIGYLGRKDGVSSFESLAPTHKNRWKLGGFMGVAGLLIMTFYSVVIGWIFHYVTLSLTALPSSVSEAETLFTSMLKEDIFTQIFYHTLSFVLITAVLVRGIKGGIEKLNFIMMPLLIAIIGGMFLYATTLSGFSQALEFMFYPEWSALTSESLVKAVGHAFFTLSLGMGAILTYAASLPKSPNIVRSSLIVVAMDTGIALIAGLMLFTFLFEYGSQPSQGPGLVFVSLPAIFHEMGNLGLFLSLIFFLALAFAGMTSAVSLTEPMVQYFIDRFSWSRFKASLAMGGFFYGVGILALLSNTSLFSQALTFGSKNLFDWIDYVTASIMLPLGGLIMALFVGFVVEKSRVEASLKEQMGIIFPIWYYGLRYVIPVALVVIMMHQLGILSL